MSSHKIFLADDDKDDWFIIEDSMSEIGSPGMIDFFSDGADLIDALNKLSNTNDFPKLIILDLNMPRTNGTDTLFLIRENDRFSNIPVIIYSTSVNLLEKQKCLELGAYDYITKPISATDNIEIAKLFVSFLKK